MEGARRLIGRVFDSRPRGHGFEPHRRHCVVSLSKNIYLSLVLVQPRKTRPFITERLLMGRKESDQTNKIKPGTWSAYLSLAPRPIASGSSNIKFHYSDHPKRFINRINEAYDFSGMYTCITSMDFSIKYRYSDILLKKYSGLFCCNHTCYCVAMVSVTSASRYITSASRYHPRYPRYTSVI